MVIRTNGFCYPDPWSQVTCGGYRMVIHTFHQPRANKPVDAQRLTSFSATFVILTHGVRWQAGVPYGHSHLSSTEANEFNDIMMMLVVWFWLFSNFYRFYSSRPETCEPDDARDSSLLGGRQSSSMAWGSVVVVPLYRFQDTEVLMTLLMSFLSFWMTGSAGRDITRPDDDVLLKQN